jgi:hypothetical protein
MTESSPIAGSSRVAKPEKEARSLLAAITGELQGGGKSAYIWARNYSRDFENKFTNTTRRMRTEMPLKTIAVIAGGAFLLGLIVRAKRTN